MLTADCSEELPYLFSVKGSIDYKSEPTQIEGLKVGSSGSHTPPCRRFNEPEKEFSHTE
jgi:hypothetical protein